MSEKFDPGWDQTRKDEWAAAGARSYRGRDFIDEPEIPAEEPEGVFHGAADEAGSHANERTKNASVPPKFKLIGWNEIKAEATEWLIKGRIPASGVGTLFGASQSFKSFVALDAAIHVAFGLNWAGSRSYGAKPVVYLAAEGAAGLKKRKEGFEKAKADLLGGCAGFHLITATPNLGTDARDREELIRAIEAAGVNPGLVVIDTLSKVLGAGDENGSGMIMVLQNAQAIADHFDCFVLIIHHTGLGDGERERGHSSSGGNTDLRILCQRKDREMSTALRWEKLKDEEAGFTLQAHMERIVLRRDEDGDDVSTLVVDYIEDGVKAPTPRATRVPEQQRLLMEVLAQSIDDAGEDFRSFTDGPMVRAVSDEIVRDRYYARIAEKPKEGDTAKRLADRQRQAFNTAIKRNIDAKRIVAGEKFGTRLLWLP